MASRDESNRVRLQVWVTVDLADRLVVAAQEQDRSVSREAARRLEASFGPVARILLDEKPSVPAVQSRASTPPTVASTPLPKKDPQPLAETMAVVREKTGQCLAFTPRGTRCKVCGKTH